MSDPAIQAVTTEQLVVAFAQGILPLAGPFGIAASAAIPALQQLMDSFRNHPTGDVSLAELQTIVSSGNTALAKLIADRAAQAAKE